jgi:hypothetical protein
MRVQSTVAQTAFLQVPVSINIAAFRHGGWPRVYCAQGLSGGA